MRLKVLMLTLLVGMMVFAGAAQACVNMVPEEGMDMEEAPSEHEDKLTLCAAPEPIPEEVGPVMVTGLVILAISLLAFMKRYF
jgi:hypothetical protein